LTFKNCAQNIVELGSQSFETFRWVWHLFKVLMI